MNAARALIIGGLVPVIAFTVIEEMYGVVWGLIAGMVFGVGEIIYEWKRLGRVDPITWGGNGLLLVLGGISLFTQEGVFFKLQPAIMELVMGAGLVVSSVIGKPFLLLMARKQGMTPPADAAPVFEQAMSGMTWRIGVFFLLNAGLATWAALYWSTAAWAFLKGIGFTVAFFGYMVAESVALRYRLKKRLSRPHVPGPR